jgi:hypothetical protein
MNLGMVCTMYFRHPTAILDSAADWKGTGQGEIFSQNNDYE